MQGLSSTTIFRSPEFIPINRLVTIREDTLAYIADGRALVGIPLSHGARALLVVTAIFGLGMGCDQHVTTLMMFARTPSGRFGAALGVRQTFNNLMCVSAPVSFGAIASVIGLTPVLLVSGLMLAAGG